MKNRIQCDCGYCIEFDPTEVDEEVVCRCGRVHRVDVKRDTAAPRRSAAGQEAGEPSASSSDFGCIVMLLTHHQDRVETDTLQHFIEAIHACLRKREQECAEHEGVDLQIACALLPAARPVWELHSYPKSPTDDLLQRLRKELELLPYPPVNSQPVVFCIRARLWLGEEAPEGTFPAPLEYYLLRHGISPLHGKDLEQRVLAAAGLLPGPPLLARARLKASSVLRRIWTMVKPNRSRLDESADKGPFGPYTFEELEMLIKKDPNEARWWGIRGDYLKRQGRLSEAAESYTRCLELNPDDDEAYVARGEAFCQNNSLEQGLRDFSQALKLNPNCVPAYVGRAVVYAELEAWDQALADFSSAIERNPGSSKLRARRGQIQLIRDEYEAAADDLDEAIRLDPHSEEAYVSRAIVRRNLAVQEGEEDWLRRALDDWDAAIRINPKNATNYVRKAELLLIATAEPAEIIAACNAAITLGDEEAAAYGLRAMAHLAMNRRVEAIADAGKAIESGADAAEIYVCRANAAAGLGKYDDAIDDCFAALRLDSNHVGALFLRGQLYLSRGEADAAVGDFDAAIELAPAWPGPYVKRGNALREREQWERAVEDYSRALELDATLSEAYFGRSCAYIELDREEEAKQDLEACLKVDPGAGPAYFSRGILELQEGSYERAEADFSKVIELEPENAAAYFNRANVRMQLERFDQAMEDFNELIRLCPTLGAAYSGRGTAWIQQGEHEKAAADFKDAVECDPEMAEFYAIQRTVVEAAYFQRKEQYDKAIAKVNEALELQPELAPAVAVRAVCHWYSEQLVESVEDFTRLIEIAGESFSALSGRGQVLAEMGEFEEALADLNRALELGKDEESASAMAYVRSGRGLALAGLDRIDEAMQDFARSIVDCPENAWVHYNHALTYHKLGEPEKAKVCFALSLALDDPPLPPRKRGRARSFVRQSNN